MQLQILEFVLVRRGFILSPPIIEGLALLLAFTLKFPALLAKILLRLCQYSGVAQ